MTQKNPFKSFDDQALINLYRLLYNQNLANKEWFKTHNPLEGQIAMHDVNTYNYVECMHEIESRLDSDLVKKFKEADDWKSIHNLMNDWIEKIETRLNTPVTEIEYCQAFGFIKDEEASVLPDDKLVREVRNSRVITAKEYRQTLERCPECNRREYQCARTPDSPYCG